MNRILIASVLSSTLLASAAAHAATTMLYDGSVTPSSTLDQSPWNWLTTGTADPSTFETYTKSATGGVTTLTTTQTPASPVNTGIKAGFANTANTLDESVGYKFDFTVAVTSETAGDPTAHPDFNDRAGFSAIVLSSDHAGVELAFWQNEIWAQSSTFTGHSTTTEHALVSTVASHAYELTIHAGTYTLTQDGTFLFGGALKTYPSPSNPYLLPNFIFLGDDTTARSATTNISYVALNAIPEPASLTLLGMGMVGLLARRRR